MRQREWVSGDGLSVLHERTKLVGSGAASCAAVEEPRRRGTACCVRTGASGRMVASAIVVLGIVLLAGCRAEKGGGGETGASGGGGTGARRNLAELAKGPQVKVAPANGVFEPVTEPELPVRPTTGSRKEVAGRVAKEALPIRPCEIAIFPCAFDGVTQANCKTDTTTSCGGQPPDPNAAVGAGRIVEVVNDLIRVTNRQGAVQCGGAVTLQTLLNTTEGLTDPRVQFDDVNQRFSFSVTVDPPVATEPMMFVAASSSEDPCADWFVFPLTFHGSAYPKGFALDFPMLGQDQNALLLSLRTCKTFADCGGAIFTVFGVPKALVYTNQHVEFNSFVVDSLTAPVTNAGNPLIHSAVSFFLAAVPGTGYKLYRITNSGGNGAVMTKTTINASFAKPTRRVNQPGTTNTIDPSDGNIVSFPYFDGTRIWFSHDADDDGFPTVLYGFVDTTKNAVEGTFAFHSGSSDDFNSSLAVGFTPGKETVYMNWAFTDSMAGTATTAVFAMGDANGPLVNIAGAGTPFTSGGGVTSQTRFGDFSSVAVDPNVSGCAFATQQYFATDGGWKTRVAPIGTCGSIVVK
jgi:hypothetical protein